MESYLGICDYKIGPPPNWRDDRFWTKRMFGKKFNRRHYIIEVEDYIKKAHERHWSDICKYDEVTAERGEVSISIEEKLLSVLSVVTEWADRYRLTPDEYDSKYGQQNDYTTESWGGDCQ